MSAPKHTGFILLGICVLGKWLLNKPLSLRKPDIFEWLLISICFFSFLSAAVNIPSYEGLHGCKNTFRYSFLAWIMYNNEYTKKQIIIFTYCLTAGLIISLIWGIYDLINGATPVLQIHGINVVTRASLYLSMMIVLFMGLALDNTNSFNKNSSYFFSACFLLTIPFLFIMASRGPILGISLAILIMSPLLLKNKKFYILLIISAVITSTILFVISQYFSSTPIAERIKHITSSKFDLDNLSLDLYTSDQIRYECWIIAWAQIIQGNNKFLGIGPGNFKAIDISKFKYKKPPVRIYIFQLELSHAHNIYLNKCAEEGIVGLFLFILFQSYIAYQFFIKNRPKRNNIQWEWVAGVGVYIIPIIAGQFNSGLLGTNAWLSMIVTGYALGKFRQSEKNQTL